MNKKNLPISISAISTSPLHFFNNLKLLDERSQRYHMDLMDGDFVPRLGLFPEFISETRRLTNLPIDAHVMTRKPESLVSTLAESGVSRMVFHFEACENPLRTISRIRGEGMEAGIALSPHTPIEAIDLIVEEVHSVTIMAISPGIIGHRFIPSMLNKIEKSRKYLDSANTQVQLEVDGGITFENFVGVLSAGADLLVCGAGTVFAPGKDILQNVNALQEILSSPSNS